MGPKKKGAKKKSKKGGKGDSAEGMGLGTENQIKHLKSQAHALEMQLAHRTEVTAHATSDLKSTKVQLLEANQKYEDERQATIDITRDMTRQYKGMQDELLNKINAADGTIHNLRDEISALRRDHREAMDRKDAAIREREREIAALRGRLEEVCAEFGGMLGNVLHQMQIEVHSAGDDEVVPISRRMEEFKLGSRRAESAARASVVDAVDQSE